MSSATAPRKTWTLSNFAVGEDLRQLSSSEEQDRVALGLNVHVTSNKRFRRRPPVRLVAGAFSANTLGMVEINGVRYTLAALGATVTTPTDVQVLRFDIPTGATAHLLEDVVSMGDTVCALLRHTIAGVQRYFLHVFDGKPDLPTYVTDPAFPWTHTLGNLPSVRMTVCANKLVMTGPGGDTFYSGVANPRKWNQKLVDDLVNNGQEIHFYAAASGDQDFVIPVKYEELIDLLYYSEWIFEQFIGSNDDFDSAANWGYNGIPGVPVTGQAELVAAPRILTTPNTAATTTFTNWTKFRYQVAAAGTWFRFRWFPPRPTLPHTLCAVVAGCRPILSHGTYSQQLTIADTTTTRFDLDPDKFFFVQWVSPHVPADYWQLAVGTTQKTYTTDFEVQAGANGRLVLVLTGYTPVIGDVLTFTQLITSDFVGFQDGASRSVLHVPSGTLRTPAGDIAWPGGSVQVTFHNGYHTACFALRRDFTLEETAAVIALWMTFGGIQSGNPTTCDFYGRLFLVPLVVITQSTTTPTSSIVDNVFDDRFSRNLTLDSFTVRNQAWDELAYQRAVEFAGAAVGSSDAGFLPTSAHDSSGGEVTLLAHVKERLLVGYRGGCQLWQLDENGENDRLLDTSPIGTGEQEVPQAVLFQGVLMTTLANGFWGVSLGGQLFDALRNQPLGDLIEPAGIPQVQACVYWPALGQFIAFADTGTEGVYFRVFDFQTKKIAAWTRWTVAGITSVDFKTMIASGSRLYFRSGTALYYFDASVYTAASPSFRDDTDAPGDGNAYVSRLRWWWNDFQRPGSGKKFVFFDIEQRGSSASFFYPIQDDLNQVIDGPVIDSTTYGKLRVGLSMRTDSAIALQLESTSESGWELGRVGIDFMYTGR